MFQDINLNMTEDQERKITNTVFRNNSAHTGGALYSFSMVDLVIDNCTFTSNRAIDDTNSTLKNGQGGAIYFFSASTISGEEIFSSINFTNS